MHESILPLLCCPICRESLSFEGRTSQGRFVQGAFHCPGCSRSYPVEDEIPYLIDPAQSVRDWEWEMDIEDLDTFAAFDSAYTNSMPTTVRQTRPVFIGRIIQLANRSQGPILDVATGRGVLLRELALLLRADQPLIGIDIDKKVLRGTQRFLRWKGLYDEVSLAVMDAKNLALHDQVIGTATTWFGFNNIPEAGAAVREVRRVLMPGGQLLAAVLNVETLSNSHLVAEEAGFADLLSREHVLASLQAAGLRFERTETFIEGVWPGNPYDALPLKGDRFAHRLVIASR